MGRTINLWIAVGRPHHVLRMVESGGDSPGRMEFVDYDQPVDASAPPEDEYVDLTSEDA